MTLLHTLEQTPSEPATVGYIDPNILLEGNPLLEKWAPFVANNGEVKVGVMGGGPGVNRSVKNGVFEFCYLTQGVIELTEDGCEPVRYKAGDTFFMEDGYKGQWKTIETYKKVYVCVYKKAQA